MSTETLLNALSTVRRTSRESWIASCPAHADRTPSLTITEKPDGRILVHCHAGCSVEEITSAAGVSMSDLFPETSNPYEPVKTERMPFNPRDVLAAVSHEALIVAIAAIDLANGVPPKNSDRERLAVAVARLQEVARICHAD